MHLLGKNCRPHTPRPGTLAITKVMSLVCSLVSGNIDSNLLLRCFAWNKEEPFFPKTRTKKKCA